MGGHCLVNWPTVSKPKNLGGLEVSDLDKFGRVLCLRWLWQDWVDDSKPWAGMNCLASLLIDCFSMPQPSSLLEIERKHSSDTTVG